jgi:hypothetical protein
MYKTNSLYKINNNHADWSGTAAYYINTSGASKLIERFNYIGAKCADGFVHRAIQENYVNVYIPENYNHGILLHPEYS